VKELGKDKTLLQGEVPGNSKELVGRNYLAGKGNRMGRKDPW